MAESRFAIAEFEAEMAAEYKLQALAARHEADSRHREAEHEPELAVESLADAHPEPGAEPPADIDIDPWRPLFEGE